MLFAVCSKASFFSHACNLKSGHFNGHSFRMMDIKAFWYKDFIVNQCLVAVWVGLSVISVWLLLWELLLCKIFWSDSMGSKISLGNFSGMAMKKSTHKIDFLTTNFFCSCLLCKFEPHKSHFACLPFFLASSGASLFFSFLRTKKVRKFFFALYFSIEYIQST